MLSLMSKGKISFQYIYFYASFTCFLDITEFTGLTELEDRRDRGRVDSISPPDKGM